MVTDAQLLDALEREIEAIELKGQSAKRSNELPALHQWYTQELPDQLADRNPRYLEKKELAKLMDYKLAREKWRPRLQQLIESNAAATVEDATRKSAEVCREALEAGESPLEALKVASDALKGVGPATASLILATFYPAQIPFLTDEASEVLGLGKPDYSLKSYPSYFAAVSARAQQATGGHATKLERACWAHVTLRKLEQAEAEAPAKKRRKKA